MPQVKKNNEIPITLSRTLGAWEVALLGIGALLGGGIFSLLGHAAGLSGGGLPFAMLLGALISFLNLNAYISLATTFPVAGGGYNWIRAGLGDLQGFMAGWFSWMGSSVACSLYAVSFGFFAAEFFFSLLEIPVVFFSRETWVAVFAVLTVMLFGLINHRGVQFSTRTGGYFSLTILAILLLYVIFGMRHIFEFPDIFSLNFSPLLPLGLVGVVQAAALYYIAFEGSEIQAQSGEEAKDPARVLKIGLLSSWAVVAALYLFVSFVIVGGTTGASGGPSWQLLGSAGERAIIDSATQFLPFGYVLMIIGGLLANLGALNATIYSSSRVLFAMARDKFVWQGFSKIDGIRKTPYLALAFSTVIISVIVVFFPLKDIASAADVLFIALFLQLNLAYIQLRRKRPEAKWRYVVPFGVAFPLIAIALYVILGISLFRVSPVAIYFMTTWFLVGLVHYLGYTRVRGEEDLEREIRYEHTMRFRQKFGCRVIFPIVHGENTDMLSKIAFAMVREREGELFALHIHEVPQSLPLDARINIEQEKKLLDVLEAEAVREQFNVETRLVAARSVSDTILETVRKEEGDILIMGWDGYVDTKGFIFGKQIDTVLHRAKCDLIVAKIRLPRDVKKIFIPVSIDDNPNIRFTGMVVTALAKSFGAEITVGMVVPENTREFEYLRLRAKLQDHVDELKIKTKDAPALKILRSDYIISAVLEEASKHDLVIMPADRGRITKAIGMGSIPEQVAKHSRKSVIMAKGHHGIVQPFFDYLKSRF